MFRAGDILQSRPTNCSDPRSRVACCSFRIGTNNNRQTTSTPPFNRSYTFSFPYPPRSKPPTTNRRYLRTPWSTTFTLSSRPPHDSTHLHTSDSIRIYRLKKSPCRVLLGTCNTSQRFISAPQPSIFNKIFTFAQWRLERQPARQSPDALHALKPQPQNLNRPSPSLPSDEQQPNPPFPPPPLLRIPRPNPGSPKDRPPSQHLLNNPRGQQHDPPELKPPAPWESHLVRTT